MCPGPPKWVKQWVQICKFLKTFENAIILNHSGVQFRLYVVETRLYSSWIPVPGVFGRVQ